MDTGTLAAPGTTEHQRRTAKGRIASLRGALSLIFALLFVTSASAEPIDLSGEWWRRPAEGGRNVTFAADFETGAEAQHALGMPLAGGFGMEEVADGLHGRALQTGTRGAHLHYRGESNVPMHRGTVRFAVRGDVWMTERPRTLLEIKGPWRIGVMRESGKLTLFVGERYGRMEELGRLELPLGEVSTDQWHTVVFSWDRARGLGWVAVDGHGVGGDLRLPNVDDRALVFFLAGGWDAKYHLEGLSEVGEHYDELAIYRLPLDVLEAGREPLPNDQMLMLERCEAATRKAVETLLALEYRGGWHTVYTWPTLIGSYAQGRHHMDVREVVDTNKFQSTPRVGGALLYAHQVLDDYRCLVTARRTAELLLAAQADEGWWLPGYRLTSGGMHPDVEARPGIADGDVILQDRVQSTPLAFMCVMYHATGDDRYRQAAMRCGEFFLRAQNPNGSWSYKWSRREGMGMTARDEPQGGELNDGTINDGVFLMALMYHMTGDRAYVDAMKRVGEWLLEAQLTGATVGWAQQYNAANDPVEARVFEPAAWSAQGTEYACEALSELHRFSGDDRYLQAIERALDWMRETAPDGEMHAYYDIETGRPIAAWDRRIYFLDDPEQAEAVARFPIARSYLRTRQLGDRVEALLHAAREGGPRDLEGVPASQWLERPGITRGAEYGLENQHPVSGMWHGGGGEDDIKEVGERFSPYQGKFVLVMRYVQAARAALGEIDDSWRGEGILEWMAWPHEPGRAHWYEIDWSGDETPDADAG